MNEYLFEQKYITDVKELEKIKARLLEISRIRDGLTSKDDKKFFDIKSQDEKNELMSMVHRGIVVDDLPYRDEIMNSLYGFFGKYGMSRESIVSMCEDLNFFVSDIMLGYGGKLVHTGNRIGVDTSYADFTADGYFMGFKEELGDFLIHTFTHEFLHNLSSKEDGRDIVGNFGDGLVEGYTEMFAHLVGGKVSVKSDLYEFPEKVCEFFTEIMGMEKTVDDYLNHNQTRRNLRNLFLECDCAEEFPLFSRLLSNVIVGASRDRKAGVEGVYALDEKETCLDFLRDNILIPYCNKNVERREQILDKFNSLFGQYGYCCSLDDIKESQR